MEALCSLGLWETVEEEEEEKVEELGAHAAAVAVPADALTVLAPTVAAAVVLIEQQELHQDYPRIQQVHVWRLHVGSPSRREKP